MWFNRGATDWGRSPGLPVRLLLWEKALSKSQKVLFIQFSGTILTSIQIVESLLVSCKGKLGCHCEVAVVWHSFNDSCWASLDLALSFFLRRKWRFQLWNIFQTTAKGPIFDPAQTRSVGMAKRILNDRPFYASRPLWSQRRDHRPSTPRWSNRFESYRQVRMIVF